MERVRIRDFYAALGAAELWGPLDLVLIENAVSGVVGLDGTVGKWSLETIVAGLDERYPGLRLFTVGYFGGEIGELDAGY